MRRVLLLLLILLSLSKVSAQSFKILVDSVYDFHPHLNTREEQNNLTPKLDSFFNLVLSDTAKYLPQLRIELKNKNHFPYFYYDGAHLLLMANGENKSDDQLIIESFVKADIKDRVTPLNLISINYFKGS